MNPSPSGVEARGAKMMLKGFLLSQLHPLDSPPDDRILVLGFEPIDYMDLFLWDTGSRHPDSFFICPAARDMSISFDSS